jgi:hypothetical protein
MCARWSEVVCSCLKRLGRCWKWQGRCAHATTRQVKQHAARRCARECSTARARMRRIRAPQLTTARGEIAGGRRRLGGGLGCEDAEEILGERKRLLCADKNPAGCRIDARRASAGQRAVGSAQGMG